MSDKETLGVPTTRSVDPTLRTLERLIYYQLHCQEHQEQFNFDLPPIVCETYNRPQN